MKVLAQVHMRSNNKLNIQKQKKVRRKGWGPLFAALLRQGAWFFCIYPGILGFSIHQLLVGITSNYAETSSHLHYLASTHLNTDLPPLFSGTISYITYNFYQDIQSICRLENLLLISDMTILVVCSFNILMAS